MNLTDSFRAIGDSSTGIADTYSLMLDCFGVLYLLVMALEVENLWSLVLSFVRVLLNSFIPFISCFGWLEATIESLITYSDKFAEHCSANESFLP